MAPEADPINNDFNQIVRASQESWRLNERGVVSRPQELPVLSKLIDSGIKAKFSKYIDSSVPPVIVAWSVLADQPKKPHYYSYQERIPEDVNPEDVSSFRSGVFDLTEYATNFATQQLLVTLSTNPALAQILKTYDFINNMASGELIYKNAYKGMQQLAVLAKDNRIDYEDTLLKALFTHDFRQMDELVNLSGIYDCRNFNELAIHIGMNKAGNKDVSKTIDYVNNTSEDDSFTNKAIARIIATIAKGGGFNHPGVVEILMGGGTANLAAGGAFGSLLTHGDIMKSIAIGSVGFLASSFGLVHTVLHESIHAYSASNDFIGLSPVKLVK